MKSYKIILGIFEKYRMYKYLSDSRFFKKNRADMELFCETIELAVNELPDQERFLLMERYLSSDGDYLTDTVIYNERFSPPISDKTYKKIRDAALYKFSLLLQKY